MAWISFYKKSKTWHSTIGWKPGSKIKRTRLSIWVAFLLTAHLGECEGVGLPRSLLYIQHMRINFLNCHHPLARIREASLELGRSLELGDHRAWGPAEGQRNFSSARSPHNPLPLPAMCDECLWPEQKASRQMKDGWATSRPKSRPQPELQRFLEPPSSKKGQQSIFLFLRSAKTVNEKLHIKMLEYHFPNYLPWETFHQEKKVVVGGAAGKMK